MPAIDPGKLAGELDDLVGLVHDPDDTTHAVLDLLDYYADRTRRPKLASAADIARRFGVPGPVLRQVTRRVAEAARNLPDDGDRLADALWEADFRETRLAAAAIFEDREDEGVPAWVEEHARQCSDSVVLNALGAKSLRTWRTVRPEAFLDRIWDWMDGSDRRLIAAACISLGAAIAEPEYRVGPGVFQGLERRLGVLAGRARAALTELLRQLGARSPAEAAQMLKDHIKHGDGHRTVASVIRASLTAYPTRQRKVLEAALSAVEAG